MRVEAAVFLMGCSSGALHTAGSYEPIGMALHFVGSGAPATVANLWDVTDGDIDQMTKTALEVCATTFFLFLFFAFLFSCYTTSLFSGLQEWHRALAQHCGGAGSVQPALHKWSGSRCVWNPRRV
jgi:hypothetical protein